MYTKLLGIGAAYGFGFTLVKSVFPTPILIFFVGGGPSSEGNLTLLASVYAASGILAGIISGPIFGALLLRYKGSGTPGGELRPVPISGSDLWRSLVLSFLFATLIGLISGLLILGAYWFDILPPGGVLDPLALIRSSNFPPGYPLLVAWSLARDILPAMLTGLLLSPFGGSFLYRIYASQRPPKDVSVVSRFEDNDF